MPAEDPVSPRSVLRKSKQSSRKMGVGSPASPPNSPKSKGSVMDLGVIDQAYGQHADLYVDVLRISCLASQSEIQAAFFDRRSELFAVLSKLESATDEITLSQRMYAERRMDAIVVAFRILRDPQLRKQYSTIREDRLEKRFAKKEQKEGSAVSKDGKSSKASTSSSRKSTASASTSTSRAELSPRGVEDFGLSENKDPNQTSPSQRRSVLKQGKGREFGGIKSAPSDERGMLDPPAGARRKNDPSPRVKAHKSYRRQGSGLSEVTNSSADAVGTLKVRVVATDDEEEQRTKGSSADSGTDDDDLSDNVATKRRRASSRKEPDEEGNEANKADQGILDRIRNNRYVCAITEEINGSVEDTVSAFDQVFNAFTLTEDDINAVTGRIRKAKNQYKQT